MPILSGLRAVAFIACGPVSGATLKVGGTGGATELLRQLAAPFEADTGIVLEVVAGLGTSGGNNALANGKLGLAVSGRHLKDSETSVGPEASPEAQALIAFLAKPATEALLRRADIVAGK